jgi:8-oxo-dGTP pyrophosphatase MutT (NUDIX family)
LARTSCLQAHFGWLRLIYKVRNIVHSSPPNTIQPHYSAINNTRTQTIKVSAAIIKPFLSCVASLVFFAVSKNAHFIRYLLQIVHVDPLILKDLFGKATLYIAGWEEVNTSALLVLGSGWRNRLVYLKMPSDYNCFHSFTVFFAIILLMYPNACLLKTKGRYKEKGYVEEIFSLDTVEGLPSISQVQALCFMDKDTIVLYENIQGFYGNPGGSLEGDETWEIALKRELIEEAQLKLIKGVVIGVERVHYPESNTYTYFLRIAAQVELIDAPIQDPDGKGIGRKVVGIEKYVEELGWGKKGEVLLALAKKKLDRLF